MALILDISELFKLCCSHCDSQCEGQMPKWRHLLILNLYQTKLFHLGTELVTTPDGSQLPMVAISLPAVPSGGSTVTLKPIDEEECDITDPYSVCSQV